MPAVLPTRWRRLISMREDPSKPDNRIENVLAAMEGAASVWPVSKCVNRPGIDGGVSLIEPIC